MVVHLQEEIAPNTDSWKAVLQVQQLVLLQHQETNTGTDHSTGVLTASTWYRRVVNAEFVVHLPVVHFVVTVNPIIANNTIGSAQTICHNTIPTSLTGTVATGRNGTYTYLWAKIYTSSLDFMLFADKYGTK